MLGADGKASADRRVTRDSLRSLARGICAAFSQSRMCVLVFDQRLVLVDASEGARVHVRQDAFNLNAASESELRDAVVSVLRGDRRAFAELTQFPGSSEPSFWKAECLPISTDGFGGAARITGPVLRNAGVELVLVVLAEDGERQALRTELERSNRYESIGKLTGSIAHDFNNLLTGIRGSVALAQQNVSPESHDSALRAADLAAQRASEMTRQLLTFARGPTIVPKTTDVAAVIIEAVELVRCLPDTPNIELDLDPDLGEVEMAAAQLHQVVLNILINAQEAIQDVGRSGRVTVCASHCQLAHDSAEGLEPRSRRWLSLTITDTGPGMAEDVRNQVFEPFFTTKEGQRGSGLGLSNVRHMVEQAGGWVEVESELDQGATFGIYLPTVLEGVDMNVDGLAPASRKTHSDRVLICDDESRLATLTAGLLEEFGYDPTTVAIGDEALEVMRDSSNAVDVLLLDVNLSSGVSAREVLETMQAEGLHLPVILTSGFAPEDVPKALREHERVASYLAKPYTVDELVDAIGGALKKSAAVRY